MLLKTLTLNNFRNYRQNSFSFSPTVTVITGSNAIGKTNILEAIYLLSTGRSFRAENESEMIFDGKNVSHVKAEIKNDPQTLEIVLTTGMVFGKKTPHKKRLVNGVSRRLVDFIGNLPAVLFWPEDLDLVTDSPSLRRNYLNHVLSLTDRPCRQALSVYEKAILIRNKLLRDKREFIYEKRLNGGYTSSINEQIEYWGKILIENGYIITQKREEYLNTINQFSILDDQLLINSKKQRSNSKIHYQVFYDRSEISEARLEQYREEEVLAGNTLVGPHRDDFVIKKQMKADKEADLSRFGSRGEQRMGVLWLKLAELSFVEKKLAIKPILLLDDILSELDGEHREIVMRIIPNQQTILTTTEENILRTKLLKDLKIIKLK